MCSLCTHCIPEMSIHFLEDGSRIPDVDLAYRETGCYIYTRGIPPKEDDHTSMASENLWLSLAASRASATISEYDHAFDSLNLLSSSYPSLTVMIGKKTKSELLRGLVEGGSRDRMPRLHGQVYLYTDKSSRTDVPAIYVDYELQSWDHAQSSEHSGVGVPQKHTIDLFAQGEEVWSRRRVGNMICGRGIAPLCDTLCYFSMDIGGIRAVAASLAEHISQKPSTDTPFSALPRVLVVVETTARNFDPHATEARILALIEEIWRRSSPDAVGSFATRLRAHYYDVRVIGLAKRTRPQQRCAQLRKRLQCIKREVHLSRVACGLRYKRDHVFVFASKLIASPFSLHAKQFSFIAASRPSRFCSSALASHIEELISLIPSEIWLCHLVVPLLSSSLILATYPPGSHSKSLLRSHSITLPADSPVFPIMMVFNQVYRRDCTTAINSALVQKDGRASFLYNLSERLELDYEQLEACSGTGPSARHVQRLKDVHQYLKSIKSHRTCLCCLFRAPEKVFSCGHAICDLCVRTFGQRNPECKDNFAFPDCILCGAQNHKPVISLMPLTAGIRLLSLDGGGVRGVIPLVYLEFLQDRLAELQVPLRDVFDFACGTSAGKSLAFNLVWARSDF
jgi:hypothetical protein